MAKANGKASKKGSVANTPVASDKEKAKGSSKTSKATAK